MEELTHLDDQGNARMVDVGDKASSVRTAIAEGFIRLEAGTRKLIQDNLMKKGDVLTIAEIAGVQAAKQTAQLIPLCHPLLLDKIKLVAQLDEQGVYVSSEVRCVGRTGVEMEALTAVNVALLTIYDMCKAVDKKMEMHGIRLLQKTKEQI
ncbi:MAG: cyclic pyranopterin monophosphate synthase MoaC [Bacteroidetes bacterium]|nr:cyclic pyranopterin monophosphate synthase MoaC [Bacteroidota bacterium]MBU1579739.1 cyclic pyranopterin monophosphate synthase MoaC [Bacteroidota bacterium]MBU2464912.1 cyclic pyranopterin monophosphate synthase MoaC [Bacteroidota bacterium]MBU2558905.1 cyclic pyranopterin monophosphate synthase MoaC [Bacteroidota bacterium]MDA3942649.1 cyclic pyranopterin monophosphate synthase MoaC [Bacteroidota bacterium]